MDVVISFPERGVSCSVLVREEDRVGEFTDRVVAHLGEAGCGRMAVGSMSLQYTTVHGSSAELALHAPQHSGEALSTLGLEAGAVLTVVRRFPEWQSPAEYATTTYISGLHVHPDGVHVTVVMCSGVDVINMVTGEQVSIECDIKKLATDACVVKESIAVCNDAGLVFFHKDSGKRLKTVLCGGGGCVCATASEDGDYLLVATAVQLLVYSVEGQELVASVSCENSVGVFVVPGSDFFVTLGSRGLTLWEWSPPSAGVEKHVAPKEMGLALGCAEGVVASAGAVSGDGRLVAVAAECTVYVAPLAKGGHSVDTARDDPTMCLKGHTDDVYSVCFAPCGMQLLSGSWDGCVMRWCLCTGTVLSTHDYDSWVRAVAISHCGTYIMAATDEYKVHTFKALL